MRGKKLMLEQFQKKQPKRTISVRFDEKVLNKAQRLKLNISEICRDALEKALSKVS